MTLQRTLVVFLIFAANHFGLGELYCSTSSAASPQGYHQVILNGKQFEVADGYRLEAVAGSPLVERPTVGCLDDRGRLVVCESAGTHETTKEQLETKPHRLARLSDADGDGVFDHRVVAAEGLSFYSGVLCVGNEAFVSTPPSIQKLTDQDGDGIYEEREVWHDGGTLTYCANDLHGPYLGRDGWIYWCKGAFAEQTHQMTGGRERVSKAAHLLRRRPTGGPVEIVMSGGMDNPVEMAFLPSGEKFFTSTFLQHPADGRRDGIGHAVYGSLFGKKHYVIDSHFRTGDLMPVMTHLGPAAPSGLAYLNQWSGKEPILACAQFNLHKVSMHRLVIDGATYRTVDTDLVRSQNLAFHPTDVIEDADGSLIILDTGDWYDLCCPSSGAEKSTERGGVYRLRKVDAPDRDDPAGLQLDWQNSTVENLISRLGDDRHSVRERAGWALDLSAENQLQLVRDAIADPNLSRDVSVELVWALARNPQNASKRVLATMAQSGNDPQTRLAAFHALSLVGPESIRPIERLFRESDSALIKRAAAECLGRWGDASSLGVLMDALPQIDADRTLEHSILYALIELDSSAALANYFDETTIDDHPRQARAALLVLSQTDRDALSPGKLLVAAQSTDEGLRGAALQTLCDRPDWAKTLAAEVLSKCGSKGEASETLIPVVASWVEQPSLSSLIPEWLSEVSTQTVVDLLRQMNADSLPPSWDDAIADKLDRADGRAESELLSQLVETRVSKKHQRTLGWLIKRLENSGIDDHDRLAIAAVIPSTVDPSEHGLAEFVLDAFLGESEDHRRLAVTALQTLAMDDVQGERLVRGLDRVGIVDLPIAVQSVVRSSPKNAESLLDELVGLPSAKTLSSDFLVRVYRPLRQRFGTRIKELTETLRQPEQKVLAAVSSLEAQLPKGDAVRGMAVFRSAKAACSACHKIGHVGGVVGPTLTGIGKSRSRHDLIEAIVYPSSHIAQGFRSTRVLTTGGSVIAGIVKREDETSITLYVTLGKESTISKSDIESRQESEVSLMPTGLDGVLSQQDLADVVELLKTFRAG